MYDTVRTPHVCSIRSRKMKTCSVCEQTKEESEFNKDRRNKYGLRSGCKNCEREYDQVKWAAGIVHNSRGNDNKANRPTNSAEYIDENWVKALIRTKPNCHYCDIPLRFGIGIDRSTNPDGLQLDRMDSALPHNKSNCVQCCQMCNQRCKTLPYQWKVLSVGGNFAHFGAKWCPDSSHGGDDHVRGIDEFGKRRRSPDGLYDCCKVCQAQRGAKLRKVQGYRKRHTEAVRQWRKRKREAVA